MHFARSRHSQAGPMTAATSYGGHNEKTLFRVILTPTLLFCNELSIQELRQNTASRKDRLGLSISVRLTGQRVPRPPFPIPNSSLLVFGESP